MCTSKGRAPEAAGLRRGGARSAHRVMLAHVLVAVAGEQHAVASERLVLVPRVRVVKLIVAAARHEGRPPLARHLCAVERVWREYGER